MGMLVALMATLSIWVSDFSVVLLGGGLLFGLFSARLRNKLQKSMGWHWAPAAVGLVLGMFMLFWIKALVPGDPNYHGAPLANATDILQNLETLWFYALNAISGNTILPSSTWVLWSHLILISTLIVVRRSLKINHRFIGLLFVATVGFFVLIASHWVTINGTPIKYFIPVIVLTWLGMLSIDYSSTTRLHKYLLFIAGMLVVCANTINLVQLYRYDIHHGYSLEEIRAVASDAPRHFMGNYWHSYVLCIANPTQFIATPHDGATQRNAAWAHQVLESDTIWVVCNDWLESAPDTLVQFDRQFIRLQEARSEGMFRLAPYQQINQVVEFP